MNERVLTVCEQQVSKTVVWFSSDWFLWSYIYCDFFQPQLWIIFSSYNPYLVLFFRFILKVWWNLTNVLWWYRGTEEDANKGARLEIFSCNQWPVPQCSRKLQYYVTVSPSFGNSDSPPNTRPREENLWFTDHSFLRVRQECGHVWWLQHIIHR